MDSKNVQLNTVLNIIYSVPVMMVTNHNNQATVKGPRPLISGPYSSTKCFAGLIKLYKYMTTSGVFCTFSEKVFSDISSTNTMDTGKGPVIFY